MVIQAGGVDITKWVVDEAGLLGWVKQGVFVSYFHSS